MASQFTGRIKLQIGDEMKGVIVLALRDVIVVNYGHNAWQEISEKARLKTADFTIMPTSDIDDKVVLDIIQLLCIHGDISLADAADVFGDYWINKYSQLIYKPCYNLANSAQEFFLKIDYIHDLATRNMPDARPPKFESKWQDKDTLIIHYHSHRKLIDLVVGLAKAVGKYYNEKLTVTKLDDTRIQVVFK